MGVFSLLQRLSTYEKWYRDFHTILTYFGGVQGLGGRVTLFSTLIVVLTSCGGCQGRYVNVAHLL